MSRNSIRRQSHQSLAINPGNPEIKGTSFITSNISQNFCKKLVAALFSLICVRPKFVVRSRFWFKKDFNVNYGDPVTPITLESLQQADLEMRAVKEELRKEVSKEKERMGQLGEQISV